jgi:hypothetical protein
MAEDGGTLELVGRHLTLVLQSLSNAVNAPESF